MLAPMAGVSVQAFRRQGRRYGAGLVCSEMVSCAGLHHKNERTLGYLRIASDEHPLAVQIFGAEPTVMAEAARMVEAAGADLVDINFGCPVRKVTKTGAGATLLEDPDRACRIVAAVVEAVDVPVSVKMRRGLENGSRACLGVGPRLVDVGASTLTLHPRSAKQMYTGEADHALTAEFVDSVGVPVIAAEIGETYTFLSAVHGFAAEMDQARDFAERCIDLLESRFSKGQGIVVGHCLIQCYALDAHLEEMPARRGWNALASLSACAL